MERSEDLRVDKTQKTKLSSRRPATTPEGREQQLVSMAVELAERQLQEGTASAQVITHYLKLGSTREQLEQLKLQKEIEVAAAKAEALASAKRVEELYTQALRAMREYSGQEPMEPDEYDEQY